MSDQIMTMAVKLVLGAMGAPDVDFERSKLRSSARISGLSDEAADAYVEANFLEFQERLIRAYETMGQAPALRDL